MDGDGGGLRGRAAAPSGGPILRTPRRAWLVWGLAVTAYAVAVFNRASFGVAGVLARERFGVDASVLSLFGVLQLAVYAGLQVPVGALLDRVGSRRLIVAGALVMTVGQVALATAGSVPTAVAARVLVGAGDAMTFISVLRIITAWFAPRQVPVVSQLTAIIGQVGQIVAAYPLVALLHGPGWTSSYSGAAALTLLVGIAVMVALRDLPPGHPPPPPALGLAQVRAGVAAAWREPGTRIGMWTHFVTQFPATVFALLWGYPFLVVGERRSPATAGVLLTLLVVIGMVIAPVLGRAVGRWPYRRSLLVIGVVGSTAVCWSLVLAWPGRAPIGLLVLLVAAMAANGPGSIVGFDYARTENPRELLGSASGIVNVGGFVASLSTILGIGLVLDAVTGPGDDYSLGAFRLAFCLQYLVWAVGLVGVLRNHALLRSRLARRGVVLEPAHRVVLRRVRRP